MAYMSQQSKALLAPQIKAVLRKYGMKGSIAVRNHSTLACNIKSGDLDVIGNFNETVNSRGAQTAKDYIQVNHYNIDRCYSGKVKSFLDELYAAMNVGNHDNSDIRSDYFDVGWYIDIDVGKWDKPYVWTKSKAAQAWPKTKKASTRQTWRPTTANPVAATAPAVIDAPSAAELRELVSKLRQMSCLLPWEQGVTNHAATILERYIKG
jgi:hypothetical protein